MAFERIAPLIAQHPQNLLQAQVAAYQQGNAQRNAKMGNIANILQALVGGYVEKQNREMKMTMAEKQRTHEKDLQGERIGAQKDLADADRAQQGERDRFQRYLALRQQGFTENQALEEIERDKRDYKFARERFEKQTDLNEGQLDLGRETLKQRKAEHTDDKVIAEEANAIRRISVEAEAEYKSAMVEAQKLAAGGDDIKAMEKLVNSSSDYLAKHVDGLRRDFVGGLEGASTGSVIQFALPGAGGGERADLSAQIRDVVLPLVSALHEDWADEGVRGEIMAKWKTNNPLLAVRAEIESLYKDAGYGAGIGPESKEE